MAHARRSDQPNRLGVFLMWDGFANLLSSNVFRGGALLATALSGISGIVLLLVKQRPTMRKLENDSEEKLRSEMWNDIATLKAGKVEMARTMREMADRVAEAERQIAAQTVQIGQQQFILNLVITELEQVSPGNTIARQARILMDAAQAVPTALSPQTRDLIDKLDGKTGAA